MASGQMGRRGKSEEQKLQDKLDELQFRYDKALENVEKEGNASTSRTRGAELLLSKIDEVKQQLKDLRGYVVPPTPKNRPARVPEITDSVRVYAPPRPRSQREGKELAGRAAERRYGSGPDRPSTVNTRSEKSIAKRIMEALGDKRTMEQASEDARVTKEMEMEREMNVAGRKKGGMVKKKKAPVKKAYGGMVKKKQGGSANKVNMKAGFTRRGCVKG
jgi:predicted ribosome quality control (RQC) complex YloA/Tae2 family protein